MLDRKKDGDVELKEHSLKYQSLATCEDKTGRCAF